MRPKQLGGKLTPKLKKDYSRSPQWKGDKFYNYERTGVDIGIKDAPKMLQKLFFDKSGRAPVRPLSILPFDKAAFLAPSDECKFIWFGHSVVLMRLNGKTILIDPMFGPNAAPIAPFKVERFSSNTLAIIDQLPTIDLVLLTHDHYDHLDLASIQLLKPKVKEYYVALGASRHLQLWGIDANKIKEFTWYESAFFNEIDITFTPSRHASGRFISDQSCCLWGGWAIKSKTARIWFSGDGGYGDHFKVIGEELGPFDFAFMECGQYNTLWHNIHMYPEESVQAALDVNVTRIMAVHWAGFALAHHHWKEPIRRFVEEAKNQNVLCATPRIGELFTLQNTPTEQWWEEYD